MTDEQEALTAQLEAIIELRSRVSYLSGEVCKLFDYEAAEDDELIKASIRSASRSLTSLKQAIDMRVRQLREQLAEAAEKELQWRRERTEQIRQENQKL